MPCRARSQADAESDDGDGGDDGQEDGSQLTNDTTQAVMAGLNATGDMSLPDELLAVEHESIGRARDMVDGILPATPSFLRRRNTSP